MSLSEDDAISVLRHYKWNMDKVQNDWFGKEKKLRLDIGLDFDRNIASKNALVNASL